MSGPKDRTRIAKDKVLNLIDQAAEKYFGSGKEWCLSLSGGEIFIHYDELLLFCQEAKKRNGYTTLITNCFWATSQDRARELLVPLKEAGLRVLGVSVGQYHREFIPLERVANAILAARSLSVQPHVRMASTTKMRLWQIMAELDRHGIWFVDFMEMPVTPAGRAEFEVPTAELLTSDEGIPAGRCPAPGLTINPSGRGMVCCNGAGEYGLDVGSIYESSYSQLENEMEQSVLLRFLLTIGPSGLLEFLPQNERSRFEGRKYVSVCHLCFELVRDPTRRSLFESKAMEWFQRKIGESFPSLSSSLALYEEPEGTRRS